MVEELKVLRGEDEELRKISKKNTFRACGFSYESDLNLSRARTRCKIISSRRR